MKTMRNGRFCLQAFQACCLANVALWLIMSMPQESLQISRHPILIMVSFDAFRYDYWHKTTTPNLHRLIKNGARAKWLKPRFPTKTYSNHHSIATGLNPESHGIVSNDFYDPALQSVFRMGLTASKWWDTGAIPIYTWNQMQGRGRYSGGMMWPGTNAKIQNQTPRFFRTLNVKHSWKQRVEESIEWLTHPKFPVNCLMMYFEEPDIASHKFGPDSPQVMMQVQRVDIIIGYLESQLKQAKLFHKVNLIILSDHGMTSVPKSHFQNMKKFSNVDDYKAYGASPVWGILPNQGKENQVYQSFDKASHQPHNHFSVYWKRDIPNEWHYQNNDRIQPILVVADNHWGIYPFERNRKRANSITGNHGYAYDSDLTPEMRAFLVVHGPAFKKGFVSEPLKNIDIFPLACCLLGVPTPPNNGSLDEIRVLLKNPRMC